MASSTPLTPAQRIAIAAELAVLEAEAVVIEAYVNEGRGDDADVTDVERSLAKRQGEMAKMKALLAG
jgi:hypothetical protein